MMEDIRLQGQVPATFFELPHLQTVVLKQNQLNGTLVINPSSSNQLQIIDLQNNEISDFNNAGTYNFEIVLVGNPVCEETGKTDTYCKPPPSTSLYSTPQKNCQPISCRSGQILSPTCRCAHPYTGTLEFRSFKFLDMGNSVPYETLEQDLNKFFQSHQVPVETVSLSDPRMDSSQYLLLNLGVFPYGQESFNRSAISMLAYVFSNQTYKPPSKYFGPYVFNGDKYKHFSDDPGKSKNTSLAIKIGVAAGASVLFLLLMLAGVYVYRQKKKADRATKRSNPFAHWDSKKSSGSIPQLKGARCFSFEELRIHKQFFRSMRYRIRRLWKVNFDSHSLAMSNMFFITSAPSKWSHAPCHVGDLVYRGTLPTGELIAIKRAQQGSMQGGLEFKTEIELLSRVHHKNVVSLLGFCFDRDEQILIYEYVANGSLADSLSGKSGIKLDWPRRLKVALGSARGLAYLHELANPPIIHRDVKSSNILLDERLNAKVSDFGLSKPMGDSEKGHVTTQVKGTMGYLDPEYYMTQHLTEKSDVYSFGVVMLEIITARKPIEHRKYIIREVMMLIDKTKILYNLREILDSTVGWDSVTLNGLEKFVDVALSCVEESRVDRPTMGEVVKEIENIMLISWLESKRRIGIEFIDL
ncbi:Leucine-rich repeat protein kinase family protein [Hibiscus syriacus]|uniref:non-specific serine/threonine protein kinase n=1 Tax=Hibiscus syriacus TaxID=106335 RepID=A0A6A2WBU2_HIBSY|nr:Leucine-rich repeat protein kinase family protein [Hibiscus syriacus]